MRPLLLALSLALAAATVRAEHPPKVVETPQQALALAKHWIADARIAGVSVGEVKTLSLVYAIDVAETDDSELHANHLIIRKDDGFSTLVYPAHDAPKLSREHRLGLEGLVGMSGMTGMSGARQKPGARIGSDVEARRHVAEWLDVNGLGGRFALEDVTSMNYLYIVDLHDPKSHKVVNQAIVRGVDGYVSLVRKAGADKQALPNFSPARR